MSATGPPSCSPSIALPPPRTSPSQTATAALPPASPLPMHHSSPSPALLHRLSHLPFANRSVAAALAPDHRPRILVISGPTAVGKSSVALELAKRLGGEIISADSVQVYEGLDIGSAKTPLHERQGIPHHLIDIVHPLEEYCVADYFVKSREETEQILAKRNAPIVVGGTGMYLRWYLYGKPLGPKSTPESKALADEELLKCCGDWDKAVEMLSNAGDPNASSILRNDWYRLRRSLEIIMTSGLPRNAYSSLFYTKTEGEAQLGDSPRNAVSSRHKPASALELDYNFLCFFLYNPRATLYRFIDQRCEEMLTGNMGILVEASWLLDLGILPNTSSASRAIGYRQAMEYLVECREADGSSSPKHFLSFLSEFQQASRNYAKRQLTWFRQEPLYHWIDASQPQDDIVNFLLNAYMEPATVKKAAGAKGVLLSQKETTHDERNALKVYQTQNRYFVEPKDCNPVLEWIKKTQSGKN